ncbi:beta-ketoacyl synthase chain length factor [Chitinivorax sp. PXF-14]|uniref:beta-ketoacyl synthase chain length factor n=1 Tax=Chitinivorax sp. PXF-14 TaxID=3230488 RepID=UPI0034675816
MKFSVAGFAAWAPGIESDADWQAWTRGELAIGCDGEPALAQMPAMLRRRAGRLSRMACDVAYRVLDGRVGVPTIFCSRHGETERSIELLAALAQGEPLSPTTFGLSVHNASGGLFSIARKDQANCIALAAGSESAAHGVIEACGLLADGAEQVLLVVADCPLPTVYAGFADEPTPAYAWAWLIEPAGERPLNLSWRTAPDHADTAASAQLPALEVLRFFIGGAEQLSHVAGHHTWHWSRDA